MSGPVTIGYQMIKFVSDLIWKKKNQMAPWPIIQPKIDNEFIAYFEKDLKHWIGSNSRKSDCPTMKDQHGIVIRSN